MAARASETPRIRVAALIIIDGKVLLVRHRNGEKRYHLLPGGGLEYRETLADAVTREVREETGLDVRPGRPLLLSDTVDPASPVHRVHLVFAARVLGGTLGVDVVDPRVEGFDLVAAEDLDSLDLRPPYAQAIKEVMADPDHATVRYLGSLYVPE